MATLLSAGESRAIAEEMYKKECEKHREEIVLQIEDQAKSGNFSIEVNSFKLSREFRNELIDLGYNVYDFGINATRISW